MNWWGRSAGLILIFVVVLFSCEEDVSTIGIRRPNSKFRVNYAEISISSSVIRFEKLPTFNRGTDADGVQRLMVGQYQDNTFGKIRTEVYAQISPPVDLGVVASTAVLDSVVLQLTTDFYYYGSDTESDQTFQIHELQDTIKERPYYNTSKVTYKSEVLGQKVINIDPSEFKQSLADNSDNVKTNDKTKNYRVVLKGDFSKNLFESLKSETDLVKDFVAFTGKYKGLAIIPTVTDKVIGIDPRVSGTTLATGTKLVMYYTEGTAQKQVNFTLFPFASNPVIAFSSIDSDRSGTILQSLTEPFKDFYPADNKRYIQSGTAILTKLDLTPYFEYMDTVKNPILNSAEFVFENESGDFAPPAQFQFRVLNDENKYMSFLQDTLVDGIVYQKNNLAELIKAYPTSVNTNTDGTIDLFSDARDLLRVGPNSTNTMSGFITSFFQDQYYQRQNPKRIKYCALHPLESAQFASQSQFRKSVNRFVLKDNIKLKIYYTTPVVETIE